MAGVITQSFSRNLYNLQIIGLYPSSRHRSVHKIFGYVVYTISMLPQLVLGCMKAFQTENVNAQDYSYLTSVAMIVFTFKFLFFLINNNQLESCINHFDKVFGINLDRRRRKIVEGPVKICRKLSTVFITGDTVAWLGWTITQSFQDYCSDLPLNTWLPFDCETQPLLYRHIYYLYIIGVLYAMVACSSIDSLAPGLLYLATSQIRLLKENLQYLDLYLEKKIKNGCYGSILEEEIYNTIVKCVLHHKEILSFVEQYENCFSGVVLTQFSESIAAIGICCLQIIKVLLKMLTFLGKLNGHVNNVTFSSYFFIDKVGVKLLVCVSFLGVVLLQVYFYCYFGTLLSEENRTLSTAVYMSNWYTYNMKSKKTLIILMERSKRPMVVTAGKIVELSLVTFTTILKRSYSLIAVLNNF